MRIAKRARKAIALALAVTLALPSVTMGATVNTSKTIGIENPIASIPVQLPQEDMETTTPPMVDVPVQLPEVELPVQLPEGLPEVGEEVQVERIEIISDSDVMNNEYGTMQMSALVYPEEANQSVTWSVSGDSGFPLYNTYAEIDDDGVLTALRSGTVTVEAVANDGSDVAATKEIEIDITRLFMSDHVSLTPGSDESELNFAWVDEVNGETPKVQFGKKSEVGTTFTDSNSEIFEGTYTDALMGNVSNKVTVTGIEPSTEYVYRYGTGDNWSEMADYTSVDPTSFRFGYIGDAQIRSNRSNEWEKTTSMMAERFPDMAFIVSAGDQVDEIGIAGEAVDEWEYEGFLGASALKSYPVATTIGNHDISSSYEFHFNNPNLTDKRGNYYFSYGDLLVISLNVHNLSGITAAEYEKAIEDAKADNPDAKWTILNFHQDIYGAGEKHSQSILTAPIRAMLYPVIDRQEIDVVLNGHDHSYSRSYFMKDNTPIVDVPTATGREDVAVDPEGTIYFTANSGSGSKYYNLHSTPGQWVNVTNQERVPSFSIVDVDEVSFTVTTYNTNNPDNIVDQYTIVKDIEKEHLETLIDQAKILETSEELLVALERAEEVVADATPSTEDLAGAYIDLKEAMVGLEEDTTTVRSIEIISDSDVMNIEYGTMQMSARVLPETAEQSVTWSVSGNTGGLLPRPVAEIDEDGVLTALRDGTATVKAVANDGSGVQATKEIEIDITQVYMSNHVSLTPGSDESELNFAWTDAATGEAPKVRIGKKSEIEDEFTISNSTTFTGTYEEALLGNVSNNVTVTELEPNTEYLYIYGVGDNWSEAAEYTTADTKNFRFGYVGDPQITGTKGIEGWEHTTNLMASMYPDMAFIVSAGDQVNVADEEEYDGYLRASALQNYPVATTIGNHDTGGNHYEFHFNNPNQMETRGNYYFAYGDVLFISLNVQMMTSPDYAQYEKEIEEAKAAHPDAKWTVLNFHQDIYGAGASHSQSSITETFRMNMYPIIDRQGVDVVLNGHDHSYSRSYFMKDNMPVEDVTTATDREDIAVNPEGTIYFTANSGSGSKYYNLHSNPGYWVNVTNQEKVPSFSMVDVDEVSFTVTTYNTDRPDRIIDQYTIVKGIEKSHLEELIEKAERLDGEETLEAAIAQAKEVVAGENPTQEDLAAAYIELKEAIVGLDEKTFVTNIDVTSPSDVIDEIGGTLQMSAEVSPVEATQKEVIWSVDNQEIATIDNNGLLTGVSRGVVEVRATAVDGSGVVGKKSIQVGSAIDVEEIIVTSPSDRITKRGGTLQMSAEVYPEEATEKEVIWSVDNESIATIDADGLLTARARGTVEVIATAVDGSGVVGTKQITISYSTSTTPPTTDRPDVDEEVETPEEEIEEEQEEQSPSVDFEDKFEDKEDVSGWAYDSFVRAMEIGLLDGVESDTINPNDEVTKVEFVQLIVDLSAYEYDQVVEYVDQELSEEQLEQVLAILEGELTREQLATLVVVGLGLSAEEGQDLDLEVNDEEEISEWAAESVRIASANGIMTGDGVNFNPQDTVTREMSIVVMMRAYDLVAEEEIEETI